MPEPEPSAELEKRAEEFSEAYENNLAFRSLVVAIPGIGSSLDLVFTSGGQRSNERIRSLINAMKEDMQERIEAIADSTVDEEYLKSEEFFDLVMKAFDATIRTRDDAKRRLYARILTESTIRSAREGRSPEEYLDLIADLSPLELRVARSLYTSLPRARCERREAAEVYEAWRRWQDSVCTDASIDSADLRLILGRLDSSGLITEDAALFPSDVGPVDKPPLYWVSPAFEKLMQFLERRDYPLEA